MAAATIKLFLPHGDAKRLRVAEISNWSGKAVAAPRTEFEELHRRPESLQSGVYVLSGTNPETGMPRTYIGEAEVLRERLKIHKSKDFWVSAMIFVSKDDNLTKAHVRYLEGRLIAEAERVGRFELDNTVGSGAKLPESDREDMEVFLGRIQQLLPVLGSDLFVPLTPARESPDRPALPLVCRVKGAIARGDRTPNGFVVYKGSTAVLHERPAALRRQPTLVAMRSEMVQSGALVEKDGLLLFTRDVEFSSPSAAASVIHGGGANGLIEWRTEPSASAQSRPGK